MGDYKYMATANNIKTLTLKEAVPATVASMANYFRDILGSEPIVTVNKHEDKGFSYKISTYGAGTYMDIAEFYLQELPGCCGILVFYHASVAKDYRGKGLGKLLLKVREESAVKAGYTVGLCTVLKDNKTENKILSMGGWEVKYDFTNSRTKNKVNTYIKNLK